MIFYYHFPVQLVDLGVVEVVLVSDFPSFELFGFDGNLKRHTQHKKRNCIT